MPAKARELERVAKKLGFKKARQKANYAKFADSSSPIPQEYHF